MKDYILLLRKDDIVDLFKYGEWYPYCPFILFDGDIAKLAADNKACESLFKNANSFDYSIEYYMLHVRSGDRKPSLFTIEEVQGIYALDDNSRMIGIELSPAVIINPPIWPDAFTDFLIREGIDSSNKGISNVGELFGISFNRTFNRTKKKDFADDAVIKEVVEEIVKGVRPEGQPLDSRSIWVYLLRYERHHNYPIDMRGYFIDAIHVYNNYERGKELDVPMHEKSTTGKRIMTLPPNIKYNELLSSISLGNDYVTKSDRVFKNYYAIAPLFLMLKSTFKNGIQLDGQYSGFSFDQYVELLKMPGYEKVIKHCLFLLGISLGWEGTYQSYYEKKGLPILR